jgi:hypothetical protein
VTQQSLTRPGLKSTAFESSTLIITRRCGKHFRILCKHSS